MIFYAVFELLAPIKKRIIINFVDNLILREHFQRMKEEKEEEERSKSERIECCWQYVE